MVRVCDIEGVLVGFDSRKIKLPDAIWVSSEYINRDCKNRYQEFSERFSYIAINDQDKCFAKLTPVETHEVRFEAERYGGRGVGANGGGGRCGNFKGVQIKGVGKNQLVGTTNKFYSYGGLNARDAVYEAIYGSILNHLLPVGTAKIFGVIFTSPDGAYNKYDENSPDVEELGWGALLVREICLRCTSSDLI